MRGLHKWAAIFSVFLGLVSPLTVSSAAFAQSTSDYNKQVAAQQARITDLQNQLVAAESKLTDLQNNSNGQAELINAAQTAATEAKDALDVAASAYTTKQTSYDVAYGAEQAAEVAVNNAISEVSAASDNVDSTYNSYQIAQSNTADADAANNAAQSAYDNSSIVVGGRASAGLVVDVYTGISRNGNPPQRSDNVYTKCKTVTVPNIQANWGGGDILGCGSDYIMLHYHGFITYPTSTKVYFMNQADDGFYMTIDGQPIVNDWSLKSCGANSVGLFSFTGGKSYAVDAWFYEWGGGACSTLYYQPLNSNQWNVAPASFFTQQEVAVTVKDPALKIVADVKAAAYVAAVAAEENALQAYQDAMTSYDNATSAYDVTVAGLAAKQDVLSQADGVLALAESDWQTVTDDKAVKDAALLTLQTKYKATFDAINNQAGVVDSLESQVKQAKAVLAAIPKPTAPSKVDKKATTKPAPPTKVAPRGKFVPNPKL